MERLWSPWRSQYIQSFGTSHENSGCVFCAAVQAGDDDAKYLVARHGECFSILNLYPYNSGHLLVVPYDHADSFAVLAESANQEMWRVVRNWVEVFKEVMHPQGFNIGTNLGRSGGAGIDSHVHIHIVPRWNGDMNFMPVICDTKVISEDMHSTMLNLRSMYNKHFGAPDVAPSIKE